MKMKYKVGDKVRIKPLSALVKMYQRNINPDAKALAGTMVTIRCVNVAFDESYNVFESYLAVTENDIYDPMERMIQLIQE